MRRAALTLISLLAVPAGMPAFADLGAAGVAAIRICLAEGSSAALRLDALRAQGWTDIAGDVPEDGLRSIAAGRYVSIEMPGVFGRRSEPDPKRQSEKLRRFVERMRNGEGPEMMFAKVEHWLVSPDPVPDYLVLRELQTPQPQIACEMSLPGATEADMSALLGVQADGPDFGGWANRTFQVDPENENRLLFLILFRPAFFADFAALPYLTTPYVLATQPE